MKTTIPQHRLPFNKWQDHIRSERLETSLHLLAIEAGEMLNALKEMK